MTEKHNLAFRIALFLNGVGMLIMYPNAMLIREHAGWIWDEPARNMAMEHMLVAVYMTMGAFLIASAFRSQQMMSFISFVIISGYIHATVMLIDALRIPGEHHHLHADGDVIGTYLAPITLTLCHPRVLKFLRTIFKTE